MGAYPSNIAKHEQTSALDVVGDSFSSGTNFYLAHGANVFKECLAIDYTGKMKTEAIRDTSDCKWMVEYAANDSTKIAFRHVGTGQWLAMLNPSYGSSMFLHGASISWYVYKAIAPKTFWLSSTQTVDCFLAAWDNVPWPGKDILNLTNRAGQGSGKGPDLFEQKDSALSCQLEWTLRM
ncbi:hypothetical protein M433DRAFT_3293 [Acidomyces richmondensis BFW]|nr:MAG: hypothetical protein FE78DRAFT_29971 [Acidomyces sp. 'richmondensis']KYG46946.1 hypothetical protein M433DRAFT_3293 [Acidomyces richmondensis BFW]